MLFILLLILFSACSGGSDELNGGNQRVDNPTKKVSVKLNLSQTYQIIDNFGASDAWACQFVGNWPEETKGAIADLLFSTDVKENGDPEGIGLSLWRFNIGAGSAQQGDESGIEDEWRRAESFLEGDGTYNWERQAGQVWFLQAAKERGVGEILGFTNSPPVQYTKNGKAYAYNGQSNLSPDQYHAFARYLVEVLKGLQQKGIEINYISPVNEPQWDWSDGGQEGTPFTNEDIHGIVEALNMALEEAGLITEIDLAEAAKIDYLYSLGDKPERGNQISVFFDTNSPYNVGDFSRVGNAISGHSYFTTSPFRNAVEKRKQLAAAIASIDGLKYWMSEYCILGDNDGDIEGNGRDLGMVSALYMARVIHNDLAIANASAWHWWLAVSPYDYKDGLIYIDKNKENGNFYESKMLWALGNFSRFIRPGSKRIDVQSLDLSESDASFLVSAYIHPLENKLISVIVNSKKDSVALQMDYGDMQLKNVRLYRTSNSENLQVDDKVLDTGTFTAPPYSITTLVGDII